jgi:hypothetical protein
MIRIPVKNHLHKYLSAKVNAEKIEIKAPTQLEIFENPQLRLRKVIAHCITPMLRVDGGFKLTEIKYPSYKLVLFVPSDSMIARKRVFLPIQAVHRLNELLRLEFLSDVGMEVDKAISEGKRIDLTILDFMAKYDIDEEDIRFDSIKKSLYRDRLTFHRETQTDSNIGMLDLTYHKKMIAIHR